MKPKITALVVCSHWERLGDVREVLDALEVRVCRVGSCEGAAARLAREPKLDFIITDIVMPDGDARRIIADARALAGDMPVLVVSPFGDVELYLEVLEWGGHDFITTSFTVPEMVHVIRGAIHKALDRRLRTGGEGSPSRDPIHAVECSSSEISPGAEGVPAKRNA